MGDEQSSKILIELQLQNLKFQKDLIDTMNKLSREVSRALLPMQKSLDKVGKQTRKFTSDSGRLSTAGKLLSRVIKNLNASFLSLLFFGRMMMGMVSPAAEMVGIFDIWNTILVVSFYPIMLLVMKYIMLPLLNTLLQMPESLRLVIGAFVLLGIVVSAVAILMSLPGGSFILAFGLIAAGIVLSIAWWKYYKYYLEVIFGNIEILAGGLATAVITPFWLLIHALDLFGLANQDSVKKIDGAMSDTASLVVQGGKDVINGYAGMWDTITGKQDDVTQKMIDKSDKGFTSMQSKFDTGMSAINLTMSTKTDEMSSALSIAYNKNINLTSDFVNSMNALYSKIDMNGKGSTNVSGGQVSVPKTLINGNANPIYDLLNPAPNMSAVGNGPRNNVGTTTNISITQNMTAAATPADFQRMVNQGNQDLLAKVASMTPYNTRG